MQFEENTSVSQLKKLKSKLESREMSTLIGAGFSKNVHNSFPSWWDLLYDIAVFLFGKKIQEDYLKLKDKSVYKSEYFNIKIEEYINNIGYLEIVSMYIKQKGYREAITTYIEERTPKIHVKSDTKKYLVKKIPTNTKEIELTNEMLSLHKALINLPWNNIYTTNYDEMLEEASDTSTEDFLIKIKNDLDNELIQLQKQKNDLNSKKKALEDETDSQITYRNLNSITINLTETQNEIQDKIKVIDWETKYNENRIKNVEKELTDIQKAVNECVSVVKHSSQLSIKRNKNIIKLHGTLRENGAYGFDNDSRLQYIIAKEDYESYPEKHEAFTQLMRISLLQESYCLIGFSGVDPNFIEWVKWVRDILEKGNKTTDYKIYLVEAGDSNTPEDLKLFYENYRIYKISLANKETLDFLEKETNITVQNKKNKKELLQLFMNYLGTGNYAFSQVFLEQRNKSKYQEFWNEIKIFGIEKIDFNNVFKNYDAIIELKKTNTVPNFEFAYSRNKITILIRALTLLLELEKDSVKQERLLNLIFIAIDDLGIIISLFWDESVLLSIQEISAKYIETDVKFKNLIVKDSVFTLDNNFLNLKFKESENLTDSLFHQKLNLLLLNFNFKQLKAELEIWSPQSSKHILQKAGFLSLFDLNEAKQLLIVNWNIFQETSIEEQLYYYQILRYYSTINHSSKSIDINQKILKIKSFGFEDLHKKFNELSSELGEKPQKLDRYGASRFTVSNSFNLSNDSSPITKGVQFVQLLLDYCLPVNTGASYFIDIKDWYKIYKSTFQSYPYPAVFFSLQYTDEKLLRRMAQDFINSDYLIEETNYLLPKLLAVYQDSDIIPRFKKSILFFCSELFVAVDSILWEKPFYEIFKLETFQKFAIDSRRDEEYIFMVNSVPFITNPVMIRGVIDFCFNNSKNDIAIDILYSLNKNDVYKNLKNKIITKKFSVKIDKLIKRLVSDENSWFLVWNIYDLLTELQIQKIKQQLNFVNYDSIINVNIWTFFIILSEDEKKVQKIIKKGIIKNKELWNTGFLPSGGLSMGHNFILLHNLKNFIPNLWTKKETVIIYNKLSDELVKIEDWTNRKYNDQDFRNILQEMNYFIEEEKDKLKNIDGFEDVYHKIKKLYGKNSNIIDGLISNNSNEIIWGLSELSYFLNIKNEKSEKHKMISVLLNKIILGNTIALEASIACLVSYIKDKNLENIFLDYSWQLIIILKKYSEELPDNTEKVFMIKKMIEIAESLEKFSISHEIIIYWKNIKKESRFNY
jgi:hypothetical protein